MSKVMRKRLCPQCHIHNFYLKGSGSEIMPVYITTQGEVVPKREGDSLDGFDTETIFCLGCSWSGSRAQLNR